MANTGVSTMTTQRIDRLLRSLVGVSDVHVIWQAGVLRSMHILRHHATQPHQLVRNIVSGMQAGFGMNILPTQVHVHDDPTVFSAIDAVADVLEPPPADVAPAPATPTNVEPRHAPVPSGAERRRPRTAASVRNGDGGVSARPSAAPAQTVSAVAALLMPSDANEAGTAVVSVERIDVERRSGTLRCRTVLSHGERRYSAIAEIPDSPSAEAELAARVAVDALRAGGLTTAMLEGVGFITVARTNYCVATIRESAQRAPRVGAAPLTESMAASATAAVLTALGVYQHGRAQMAHAGN